MMKLYLHWPKGLAEGVIMALRETKGFEKKVKINQLSS